MSKQLKRREPVNWFSRQMEERLRQNDHKSGWQHDNWDALIRRLREETEELIDACRDMGPNSVVRECADIANFAMMIADNARQEMEHATGGDERE